MRRFVVIMSLLAAACTGERPPAPAPDVLVVGTTDAAGSLDPALCYEAFCAYAVLPNTHAGLTSIGADLRPAPGLARSWTVSEDGRSYRFDLRSGVQLHDSTTVDAEVVRASLERAGRLARDGTPGEVFSDAQDGVTAITAEPDAVTITLARPDASLPARLAFASSSIVSPAAYPESAAGTDMAGTGPYTLDGEPRGDGFDLVATTEDVSEERVRVRVYPTATALAADLVSGQVHVAWRTWSPDELDALTTAADVRLVSEPGPATRFLGFNVGLEPFDDVSLRRAVAAAIDPAPLASGVQAGAADPLYSLLPEGYPGHVPVFADGTDDVGTHLAEAGYGPDDVLEVDLWFTPAHYGEAEADAAEAIAAMLEATGRFAVTVHAAEWPDYQGGLARSRLGMFLLGWFPDHLDPDAYLRPFLHSSVTSYIGSSYADEAMDAMLDDARAATDAGRRADVLEAIQRKVAADVPYVPLWRSRTVIAHHASVSGVELTPAPYLRLASIERTG